MEASRLEAVARFYLCRPLHPALSSPNHRTAGKLRASKFDVGVEVSGLDRKSLGETRGFGCEFPYINECRCEFSGNSHGFGKSL